MKTIEEINQLLKKEGFDLTIKKLPTQKKSKYQSFILEIPDIYDNRREIDFMVKSIEEIDVNELLDKASVMKEYQDSYKQLDESITFEDQLQFVSVFLGQYSYGEHEEQLDNLENLVTTQKILDSLLKLERLEKTVKEQEANIKKLSSQLASLKKKNSKTLK